VDEFRKPEVPDLYIEAGTIYNKFPFLQAIVDDFLFLLSHLCAKL
jgi:hypothetical protein